jgi:hypothetical protein
LRLRLAHIYLTLSRNPISKPLFVRNIAAIHAGLMQMRKQVPANELTADLDHIARSLAKVRDPVKRYLLSLLVEIIADYFAKRDALVAIPNHADLEVRPRGKPH